MWERLLDTMMRGFVKRGRLEITYPDGHSTAHGEPADTATSGVHVALALHDPTLPRKLVLNPDLALGEGYMDGRLTIETGGLDGLFGLVHLNMANGERLLWRRLDQALRRLRRRIDQWNPAPRARANVAHHYDLDARLYELFLDEDRQYSCAYFARPDMTLEEAQAAKKAHIAGKLLLEPGMDVLDIGCGWGGLGLTLARDYGVRVHGVTLSEEQHRIATERAEAQGLSDRVRFELRDYRTLDRRFDRVVSVGMFEHVGAPHFLEYFTRVHDLLTDDGVALIHTIGRTTPPGSTSPWIAKYIFPGGYIPALSEISAAVEKTGLYHCDVEMWRLHYAETLKHWHDRFVAREEEARALYDERFCRMWRYYLKACEHTFRGHSQCVFQLQLARRQDAVPLTRDYLYSDAPETARMEAAE